MRLLLVCEGVGDEQDLRAMTWTAFRYAHDWLVDHERIEDLHPWIEFENGASFLRWGDVNDVCERLGVPPVQKLGHPLHARATRRLLTALRDLAPDVARDGVRVVIAHDSDHVSGVFESIAAARDAWLEEHRRSEDPSDVDVAVGVAHPEHEAWAIAVFEARSDEEVGRLDAQRKALGFDPTREPERLTSGRSTNAKDAKVVLRKLVGDDAERRAGLLRDATVGQMLNRGRACGLAEFVCELVTRAATASGAVPRERSERVREAVSARLAR